MMQVESVRKMPLILGRLIGVRNFTNLVYWIAARLSGTILNSSNLVESVFVHRSVATGEISFGHSDIDLVIIVRQPEFESADGPELALLYRKVRALRWFNPAIPHMAVQDPLGINEMAESDTYLASLDRRSARLLSGKRFGIPHRPLQQVHALRHFALWQDGHLAAAVRHGDSRNLRKIALNMWNAYAVASGRVQVPFLTRSKAGTDWKSCRDADPIQGNGWSFDRGPAPVFALAKRLHDTLLPPLKPLRESIVRSVKLAPRFHDRLLVVIPEAGSQIPSDTLKPGSFLATPELLHLYLHYVNPFLDWTLPNELRDLGFRCPTQMEFVRAFLFYGHSHTCRNPGFMYGDVTAPSKTLSLLRHSVAFLQNGKVPPPISQPEIEAFAAFRPSIDDYFRKHFARIYFQNRELWEKLKCMQDGGEP